MRLDDQRTSSNVEDRRGGGAPRRGGGSKLGLGGIVLVLAASWALGLDPRTVLSTLSGSGAPTTSVAPPARAPRADDPSARFTSKVLASTEDVWKAVLPALGHPYSEPKLVLFSKGVDSGCGFAQSAMGPFYCPADSKVYLDLDFFEELHRRFRAPGDFAQAYVIAHEVGHHVQNLLGTSDEVHGLRAKQSKTEQNHTSVRLELQADCYAGVWGYHAQKKGILDPGDLDEALTAANAIGDDTLQRSAGRSVVPDAFTHGSSAERKAAFQRGFTTGNPASCPL